MVKGDAGKTDQVAMSLGPARLVDVSPRRLQPPDPFEPRPDATGISSPPGAVSGSHANSSCPT
jgi:hypothetical protein